MVGQYTYQGNLRTIYISREPSLLSRHRSLIVMSSNSCLCWIFYVLSYLVFSFSLILGVFR
jgi:hypothetical protein